MEKTPFDDFILELLVLLSKNPKLEKVRTLSVFFKICRASYVQILKSSNSKDLLDKESAYAFPNEWCLKVLTLNQEKLLAYFNYISLLNIYQKSFTSEGFSKIPKSFEIRFYRNKAVEHWSDYLSILENSNGNQNTLTFNKVAIPYHFHHWDIPFDKHTHGKDTFPEVDIEFQERLERLRSEFKKLDVDLNGIDGSTSYDIISDIIFSAIKKSKFCKDILDPHKKDKFEPLIQAMFSFCFPIPIYQLEKYATELIIWAQKEMNDHQF